MVNNIRDYIFVFIFIYGKRKYHSKKLFWFKTWLSFVFLYFIGFGYLYVGFYSKSKNAKYFLVTFSSLFIISYFLPVNGLYFSKIILKSIKETRQINYLNRYLNILLFIPGISAVFLFSALIKPLPESSLFLRQATLFCFFAPFYFIISLIGKSIYYSCPMILLNTFTVPPLISLPLILLAGIITLPIGKTVY